MREDNKKSMMMMMMMMTIKLNTGKLRELISYINIPKHGSGNTKYGCTGLTGSITAV